MASRYDNVDKFINDSGVYRNIFKDRGVQRVQQYGTRELKYPTVRQIRQLKLITYTWRYGDRYYNLSDRYYGQPKMWWVIAFFNQKPAESMLRYGDIIYIPTPIERVLSFYGV
tara:strand:+ start:1598 stop:1936 length:339 start_codon:yes stop_codon:yes gene_type:complete